MSMVRRIISAAVLGLVAATGAYPAPADEYTVKAAFVRNILPFVEWPTGVRSGATLPFCAFNDSLLAPRLADAGFVPVHGATVKLRTIASVPEVSGCRAIFVPGSEVRQLADIASRYAGAGVLVISEGVSTGAAIDMVVVDGRVAFDVDLDAARAFGVTISSKVLRLARRVTGDAVHNGDRDAQQGQSRR